MNANTLIGLLIFAGSALMLVNIILYIRFVKHIRELWDFKEQITGLFLPLVLLVLFLAGYLFVGLMGHPDIVMGSILFGGSVFVFIILQVLMHLADGVHNSEKLRIDLSAAEQASKSKTIFLSNMSHDIRTPLNAIIGYSTLAERENATNDELREYIGKIGVAGRHLLDLINDVLEMSRIESGRMHLEETETDILKITDEVHLVFSDQMQSKGIAFEVDTSGIRHRYVMCDRVRLTRIFMNLISNAYKFTHEGGSVRVSVAEEDDGNYTIIVSDNGIGMSREFAAKVFDAFERERTSTVSSLQGTGLGMAITRSIVEMMGGTIEVDTEEGKGTTFTVHLNMRTADHDSGHTDSITEKCDCAAGMRLLLAEDVEVNREIAVMILKGMGFDVDTVVNGQEAVEKVMNSEPGYYDAVLMDIQMPVMDGYEATALIRAIPDPELAAIPIIAVTANAFAEDVQMALDAGMDGHISKPLDPGNMRKVFSNIFGCTLSE